MPQLPTTMPPCATCPWWRPVLVEGQPRPTTGTCHVLPPVSPYGWPSCRPTDTCREHPDTPKGVR